MVIFRSFSYRCRNCFKRILDYSPNDYDLWAEMSLNDGDYAKELEKGYRDLGYNLKEIVSLGMEL